MKLRTEAAVGIRYTGTREHGTAPVRSEGQGPKRCCSFRRFVIDSARIALPEVLQPAERNYRRHVSCCGESDLPVCVFSLVISCSQEVVVLL